MATKTEVCFAGFEVPKKGACTVCGAKPGQKCMKAANDRRRASERERIKRIADRAEARRSLA
jgi:hypothetical protein